jgi:hypothetical protein
LVISSFSAIWRTRAVFVIVAIDCSSLLFSFRSPEYFPGTLSGQPQSA